MNVQDIIEQYLRENGYDGLFLSGDCACVLKDLVPCGSLNNDCQPGYIHHCDACDKNEECPLDCGKDWDFCLCATKAVPATSDDP